MAEREGAHSGKHVSQPLVDEYTGIDDLDEPVVAGAWKPVVSANQATGKQSFQPANYGVKRKKKWTAGRIAALLVTLAVVGVLGYIGFEIFKENYKADVNEQLAPESSEDAQAALEVLTPTTSRDPFYLMIIGSDSRIDGELERSDTNIVARVDPQAGTIAMVSIPRDTAIMLEGYGTQKFNAALAYEGIPGAIKAAEGLLGVKISHYAMVDFDGMIGLVDAIGGVTVDVPVRIDDPDAGSVVVEAGLQELNGEQALVFARSRAYTTGDFQRATNQRTLIAAMLNKCMELTRFDVPRVIESAAPCMTTDMSVTMLEDYALWFMNFEEITTYSVMVPSTTVMNNDTSYVVCDTAKLQQVMLAINEGRDPSPYVTDFTITTSEEAQAAGMEDAIGIDSRLVDGIEGDAEGSEEGEGSEEEYAEGEAYIEPAAEYYEPVYEEEATYY